MRAFLTRFVLAVLAALVLSVSVVVDGGAADLRGTPGPNGRWLPSWLRLIGLDGQVLNIPLLVLDAVTLCPVTGSGDIWAYEPGRGTAIIELAGQQPISVTYAYRIYTDSAFAKNPSTTSDFVLLGQDVETIFSAGAEDCTRHFYGASP